MEIFGYTKNDGDNMPKLKSDRFGMEIYIYQINTII